MINEELPDSLILPLRNMVLFPGVVILLLDEINPLS
jgi:hypothetical protein